MPIPLKLKGPLSARGGVEFIVNVTDGSNQNAVQDAVVTPVARATGSALPSGRTDAHGNARLTLAVGTYDLKATKAQTITSNVLQIIVR